LSFVFTADTNIEIRIGSESFVVYEANARPEGIFVKAKMSKS
jgi:hypothetical protein